MKTGDLVWATYDSASMFERSTGRDRTATFFRHIGYVHDTDGPFIFLWKDIGNVSAFLSPVHGIVLLSDRFFEA